MGLGGGQYALQRAAGVCVAARGNAGEHQLVAGAGHGHVEGVELFARALGQVSCQGLYGAGGRLAFTGQERQALRGRGLARPRDENAQCFGPGRSAVGVQQEHGGGFQSFGTMHGEQTHSVGVC